MDDTKKFYHKCLPNFLADFKAPLFLIAILNLLFLLQKYQKSDNREKFLFITPTGTKKTKFECYELYNDTHCEFHNIFFDGQSFFASTNEYNNIKPVMINPMNLTKYWKPKRLNSTNFNEKKLSTRKGISFIVENTYANNIGHTLLDVLHPLFLKLLMLNFSSDQEFDLYINRNNYVDIGIDRKFPRKIQEVFTSFSKGSMYLLDPKPPKLKELVIIEHLYAGVGRLGQRYINRKFNMPAAIDFNSIQQFRNRFYKIYNISIPKKRDKILFVNNRRFAICRKQFKSLALKFGNQFPQYTSKYVSYKGIPFRDQLILLSETILYVTGPGTAMLNFIFLTDKTFMYNTGDAHDNRKDRYLEELIVESLPYVQVFYYYGDTISNSYDFSKINEDLSDIVKTHLIPNNFSRNWNESGSGLSFVAKKYTYYCDLFPKSCDFYLQSIYSMQENGILCLESCSWPEPILFNFCKKKKLCKFNAELPFVCDHNYSCKIINPTAN